MMNFWDTVAGNHLADTLNRQLPRIANALTAITNPKKRKQHASVVPSDRVEEYLNEEFEKGNVFVSVAPLNKQDVLVITESC